MIIDDIPSSYMLQPDNGIPITQWFGDPSDLELTNLVPALIKVSTQRDCRAAIKMMKE